MSNPTSKLNFNVSIKRSREVNSIDWNSLSRAKVSNLAIENVSPIKILPVLKIPEMLLHVFEHFVV